MGAPSPAGPRPPHTPCSGQGPRAWALLLTALGRGLGRGSRGRGRRQLRPALAPLGPAPSAFGSAAKGSERALVRLGFRYLPSPTPREPRLRAQVTDRRLPRLRPALALLGSVLAELLRSQRSGSARPAVRTPRRPLRAQVPPSPATMLGSLKGQVCVVTGASRGIGRGIALQLCEAGATVYITGRKQDTLQAAASEAQSRGGRCVPVVCDSAQEDEVRSLFERVDREQDGRLDILVNNAYAGVQSILSHMKKPFWECPASLWDDINNVGLRGHYLCSVYGARLMVPARRGLIVVISSMGGLQYLFSVPYGVGKAACDRLAADCAQELRRHGVAYVSLWPGLVKTETVVEHMNKEEDPFVHQMKERFLAGETTELSGKCVVALATDPDILQLSGRVLPSCDLARRYGFKDVDGRPVADFLSLGSALSQAPRLAWLAPYMPSFFRIPKWILTLYSSKF